MNNIKRRYFIAIFVLFVFVAYSIIYKINSRTVDILLTTKTDSMFLEYQTIYHNNQKIADLIFETEIGKSDIIELFKYREREKLYQYLLVNYKKFRAFSVRQLHFHLPNNDSFLRMHRPSKFGDNLSKTRLTVKYVNENKRPIDGFEEGKVFNGFRFVYPLFDGTQHIGSVEISFSALAFIKEIESNYKIKSNFLIDKRVVDENVFKSEQSNYVQSTIPQYYFQKSILDSLNIDFSKVKVSKEKASMLHKGIQAGKPFSIYDKRFSQIVTFIPMKSPITKRVTAALTFRSNDVSISKENRHAVFAFSISTTIIALILLLIYKELRSKAILQQKIKERTKELLIANKQLEEMAHVDSLTGAHNRRYLYEIAKKLIPFVKRENQTLSVAMFDLDDFKDVNDTYGHDIGDEVLKIFVTTIKNSIRESDIFVRFGGEEFVLLLPNTDSEDAKIITEKLRKLIENCNKVDSVRFTVSIGVATFIPKKDDLESILKKADEALYKAKDSGRNRVVYSGETWVKSKTIWYL